jgi:hypothetical protein
MLAAGRQTKKPCVKLKLLENMQRQADFEIRCFKARCWFAFWSLPGCFAGIPGVHSSVHEHLLLTTRGRRRSHGNENHNRCKAPVGLPISARESKHHQELLQETRRKRKRNMFSFFVNPVAIFREALALGGQPEFRAFEEIYYLGGPAWDSERPAAGPATLESTPARQSSTETRAGK